MVIIYSTQELINQMLLSDIRTLNNWFYEKLLILIPGKCYFMSIGKGTHDKDVFIMITLLPKSTDIEEILGVTIFRKLTFHQQTKKIWRTAGHKLSTLLRLSLYT